MTGSAALEGDDVARTQRGKRPTLKMVAEAAGVSTATVSYVLSGRSGGTAVGSGVAKATAERVLAAAEALHYLPNRSAQAIRTGKNGVALLSLHMMSDPWSLAVADAVNEAANESNLTTVILADGDWYQALQRQPCDVAYIDVVHDTPEDREKLATLVKRGQRLVVFSDSMEADGFDVIRSDSTPGAHLAIEHLLEHHTKIACLTSMLALDNPKTSLYGAYTKTMEAAGIAVEPRYVAGYARAHAQASAFTEAIRLLSQDDPPTAIFANTDFAAIAAINAALRLGLRVPEDLAVVGVGNTPDGELNKPALTTFGPDNFYKRQAAIIVDNALATDHDSNMVHNFEWSVIVRESSAPEKQSAA